MPHPTESSKKVYLLCVGVRIVYIHPIKMFFVVRKINIENVGAGRCEVLKATLKIKSLPDCGTLSVGK
jgi:hypothetical protein